MKYIVVLGDGMSDYPVQELGNRTPLQAASKPGMDYLARHGVLGLVQTIPEGVSTGSDTANLSVMGFDPIKYYTGRSPIEAVSMGVSIGDDEIAYRCNLVTLSGDDRYEDKTMLDYSADEISSEEAAELVEDVNKRLLGELSDKIRFYPGISYRHCMLWNGGGAGPICTPPHDILTRVIGEYLPADSNGGGDAVILNKLMNDSFDFLSSHKVNRRRTERGLLPANSLWLWGQGGRLALPSFTEKYNKTGAVISAVDLIKGIGISAGLRSIDVEGATGTLNTNYRGKAEAALAALEDGCDFIYIHVESPDECGHRHETDNKVKSIEYIDANIISVLLERLDRRGEDYSILLLPDHATPLSLRTHTKDPAPFALYASNDNKERPSNSGYDEAAAAKTGVFVDPGYILMDKFLNNSLR
jgi:2,3-bisphosphoglycerate-independent phosphoglycerate mutase